MQEVGHSQVSYEFKLHRIDLAIFSHGHNRVLY